MVDPIETLRRDFEHVVHKDNLHVPIFQTYTLRRRKGSSFNIPLEAILRKQSLISDTIKYVYVDLFDTIMISQIPVVVISIL